MQQGCGGGSDERVSKSYPNSLDTHDGCIYVLRAQQY